MSEEDEQHILDRHRNSATHPNKTKFPKEWNDDKILRAIEETLNAPDRVVKPIFPNERYQVEKMIDDVTVRVSYYYQDGMPVFHSAYPLPR
ncbi:MAG: EndoU domain-containing protein [Clostridiales Family XIII bacterium]|nr:EndoU domain-containing protein [Clostridiales Family XIII bacterium]